MKSRNLPEPKPLFLERMKKLFSEEEFKKYLKILKIAPLRSIRCNTLKISPQELKKKLENKSWKIKQPWKDYPEVMIVKGKFLKVNKSASESERSGAGRAGTQKLLELEPGELGRALEHLLGYYYIQELASMLPVIALKPKQDEIILDLCSAPGSKTTQLAAEMQNTGTIIANDVSLGRIKILASNLERCGVTNTIITKKDGIALCRKLKKNKFYFDKILVDVPCSGEGTLRSSPKTYVMWNIKTIKALPKIQKALLKSALEILKPNGEIIYSTCTHAPEENEGVVNSILEEFKDKIKIEKISLPIKCREGIKSWEGKEFCELNKSASKASVVGLGGREKRTKGNKFSSELKKACRIYPQDNNTEGFFLVKIKKNG